MIEFIAVLLCIILFLVAFVHAYWAFGGLWPATSEPQLAKTVIGSNGINKMPPPLITGIVSIGIFAAGVWPLMWAGLIPYPVPQSIVLLGMYALTGIFILRGLAGYSAAFKASQSEEPFATLDHRYFSPLCILVGAGFAALILLARY